MVSSVYNLHPHFVASALIAFDSHFRVTEEERFWSLSVIPEPTRYGFGFLMFLDESLRLCLSTSSAVRSITPLILCGSPDLFRLRTINPRQWNILPRLQY